jgi:FAD/FMN-containing dehydrogenase
MSEPKIHHKTLEAMKRREAEQSVSPTEIGWEEDVVIKKSMVDNLLSRIESLEQEKNIKPVSEAMKREIYKWACQFSYFLFSRNNETKARFWMIHL